MAKSKRYIGRVMTGGSALALGIALQAAPALAADQAAAASPAPTADQEIVVTGARAAERAAILNKRLSLQVVESIVADDVGKLPDQNVAEAVKRLPGLSVANDQGEGRYVIIRGVNPNLVNVTVNGMTQPAPEPDGRQVKLDDIPSSLISQVTVSKSLTADLDANAIGGAVDIRTLSAFDKSEAFFVTARGEYGRYQLNREHPYEGDAQIGGRFGSDHQFGAVISASFSHRPIQSENFQGSTVYDATGRPDQFGLRDYNLVRERTGVVGNFDWRPSGAVKLFVRGTYSKFTDDEARDQNRVDSLAYTGATSGTFVGRPSVLIRRREEDDNTKSVSGGGSFKLGGSTLDLTGAWARAVKADPLRSEFNFRGNTTTTGAGARSVAGTYDVTTSPYLFVVNPPFATNYSLNSVNYDRRRAAEQVWQLRADYSVPVALGDDTTIKIGAKYLNRHKTNDRNFQQFGLATGQTFTAANASFVGDTGFYDGRYVFGPRIDYDTAQAYVTANPAVLTQSAANLQSTRNNSLVNDYDVREKIAAGYAMATIKFGDLIVIPGVRIEHTKDHALGKLITATSTPTQGFNSVGDRSYTDIFPGVNLKYSPTDSLVLRGAVTTAIGRPNYPDLTPFVSVDVTASPVAISQGNPSIKPYKAVSFDLAAEYYLPHQGILAVGLFYKQIDDPIYSLGQTVLGGTFAGQIFATALVTQPVNATKAYVKGIEFNVSTVFDFLPGPLAGFGVSANFTLVGGHGEGLTNRVGNFPLFFQSKRIGSVQLTYEMYGISARLAYSYRSQYLDILGANAAGDQYTDKNGQLDARIGYSINDHITVYAQGTNLTDTPFRRYIGTSSQLIERERYDYSVRGGVQLKF